MRDTKKVTVSVTLPLELVVELRRQADQQRRVLSQQVQILLERGMRPRHGKPSPKSAPPPQLWRDGEEQSDEVQAPS